MIEPDDITNAIKAAIPDADVVVTSRDNIHFYTEVTSAAFVGKSLIQQHRMVLNVLRAHIANEEIHAISVKTFQPNSLISDHNAPPNYAKD